MKQIYFNLFLILFFNSQVSFGQQMPIDFSDAAENFSVWGGSGFSTRTSPTDSNNTVGQFVHAASAGGQGFYIDLTRPIDLDLQKTITLSFYAFDPNVHTIALKLERGINPDIQVNVNASSQNNWKQLTFDFSTVSGNGTYDRLTVIIDDGNATPGTYLIDDIDDGSTPTTPVVDVVYDNLVWADEFDSNGAVNSTNWHHQTQVIIPGVGWANNEAQHYTNRIDNSFVTGGNLNIVAKKESFTDQGLTKQYTSARLNSKFAFTYGRVDVRAKIPVEAGTWPAIWMLGKNVNEDGGYWDTQGFGTTNWPACGEIDIMEHGIFPNEGINFVNSALHTPCCNGGNPNGGGTYTTDLENSYHVYSVNWSPNQMTFLIDDVIFYIYNPTVKDDSTWPFYKDQYILLNVAMEGIAGSVDPSFTQASMIIDYVRVFQSSGLSNSDFEIADIKVFPNPAISKVTVSSASKLDKIELYDMLGKLILINNNKSNVLDVSSITKGMYLLKIYSGERTSTKKLVLN